jgi:hypothetical protein
VLCGVVNNQHISGFACLLFRWPKRLEHQKMGPMQPVPTLEGSLAHCAHSWLRRLHKEHTNTTASSYNYLDLPITSDPNMSDKGRFMAPVTREPNLPHNVSAPTPPKSPLSLAVARRPQPMNHDKVFLLAQL